MADVECYQKIVECRHQPANPDQFLPAHVLFLTPGQHLKKIAFTCKAVFSLRLKGVLGMMFEIVNKWE